MIEHLTDADVIRVLAFDDSDDDARLLADHAASCPACTARLADEAQLELLAIESAETRSRAVVPLAPRRSRRTVIALGAALAVAAAAALVATGATRTPPITSAAVDMPSATSSGASPAASSAAHVDRWVLGGERYTKISEEDASRTPSLVRGLRRSDGPGAPGFGSLGQGFVAASGFAGKRVRFSADVRTVDVDRWAGLWLRADAGPQHLVLDNMANRPIRGTTPYTRQAVVVDVPASATTIVVGILLEGSGAALFADSRIETVGNDVPVTMPKPGALAPEFVP